MSKKDPYEVLGLERDATSDQITKRYRELARKYHPDANVGDRTTEGLMKEVNNAYSILSNPKKRIFYDLSKNYEDIMDKLINAISNEIYKYIKKSANQFLLGVGVGLSGYASGAYISVMLKNNNQLPEIISENYAIFALYVAGTAFTWGFIGSTTVFCVQRYSDSIRNRYNKIIKKAFSKIRNPKKDLTAIVKESDN